MRNPQSRQTKYIGQRMLTAATMSKSKGLNTIKVCFPLGSQSVAASGGWREEQVGSELNSLKLFRKPGFSQQITYI